MAEERRKGPPERRRSRAAKPAEGGEQATSSPATAPDAASRGQDPNDVARFDAEQLDESLRTRQQEDRGEVF